MHMFAAFREISLKQFSSIVVHPIYFISLMALAVSTNGSTVIGHRYVVNTTYLLFIPFLFLHVVSCVKTVYRFPESSSNCINWTAFNCHWIILRTSWWSVLPNIHNKSVKLISFHPTSSVLLVRKQAHMIILGPQNSGGYLDNKKCSIYQIQTRVCGFQEQIKFVFKSFLCLVIPRRGFNTKKAKWNQI